MTRERAYAWRYVHAAGPVTVFLFLYTYFIGPMLTLATGIGAFKFLNDWIRGASFFWTGSTELYTRSLAPSSQFNVLAIAMRNDGQTRIIWGFLLSVGLAIFLAGRAFLDSVICRESLPARRKLSHAALFVTSAAWAMLALSAVCTLLANIHLYDDVMKTGHKLIPQNWRPSSEVTPVPLLVMFAVALIISLITLIRLQRRTMQFWRLERISFWLLVVSSIILTWTILTHERRGVDHFHTSTFLGGSVLLWAWTCRVILLFNFARFEREAANNPDTSCFACGYDLRGSQQSVTCPECGAKIVVVEPGAQVTTG